MNWRLIDIPVYEKRPGEISASIYNNIRLGKIRLKQNLHLELEGLRSLEFILEDDAWIVVDRNLNELPVMAWTDFQIKGRDNLHLPIKCTILYYHAHAEKLEKQILDAACNYISELLKNKY